MDSTEASFSWISVGTLSPHWKYLFCVPTSVSDRPFCLPTPLSRVVYFVLGKKAQSSFFVIWVSISLMYVFNPYLTPFFYFGITVTFKLSEVTAQFPDFWSYFPSWNPGAPFVSFSCLISNCIELGVSGTTLRGLHTWSFFVHGLWVFEKVQNSIYIYWVKLVN